MPYPAAFFRILGIPEGVSTPSPYQLLGLDADAFDPAFVGAALQRQKQRLRQNLPNPQLIPLVAVVERDLDAAAELLADDARREAYHREMPSDEMGRNDREAKAQRWLALMAGQQPPAPEPPKPAPVRQPEPEPEREPEPEPSTTGHDIAPQAVVSFFESAVDLALSNGTLTPDEECQLTALALRMGITADTATAIVEQRLTRTGARRDGVDHGPLKESFAEQTRLICANGRTDARKRERLCAIGMSRGLTAEQCDEIITTCLGPPPEPEAPTRTWHIVEAPEPPPVSPPLRSTPPKARASRSDTNRSTWVERHIIGLLVAGGLTVFIALVIVLGVIIEIVADWKPMKSPDIFSSHEPSLIPLPPVEDGSTSAAPTPDSPSQPEQPPVHDPPPPPPPPDSPATGAGVHARLRTACSTTNITDDLLADVALAMLASCDLVERCALKRERSAWANQLDMLLRVEPAERVARMVAPIRNVVIPSPARKAAGASLLTPDELQILTDNLFAQETGLRYAALETLRKDDSPQAAAALRKGLKHFGRGASPDTYAMAIRLIQALSTMRDPAVPVALAHFIPQANSLSAHRITIVLSEGALPAGEEQRRLPRASSTWLRKKAAGFWKKRLARDFNWQGMHYRSEGNGVFTVIPHGRGAGAAADPPKPAWQPRREPLAILSLAAFYTTVSAGQLRSVNTQSPDMKPTVAGHLPDVAVSARADEIFAEALRSLVSEIALLAKRHAPGEHLKIRAGEIAMETTARCVASATALQQATVRLEAIGQLLLLMVQDDLNEEQRALIERLQGHRNQALADTANVLVEMREHTLFNIALWELMQGVRL